MGAPLPPPDTSDGVDARLEKLAATALRIKAERDALLAATSAFIRYMDEPAEGDAKIEDRLFAAMRAAVAKATAQ